MELQTQVAILRISWVVWSLGPIVLRKRDKSHESLHILWMLGFVLLGKHGFDMYVPDSSSYEHGYFLSRASFNALFVALVFLFL